jgi:stearoyl-CoA desaturase (delta-9 desaturase)
MVPLAALFAAGMFLCEWSVAHGAIALLFWFLFGCLGVEITLHRYYSHHAFALSPAMEKLLTVISIYGAQHSPIWWRALHVRHHREADSPRDIHSPENGFWHALIGWYWQMDPKTVSFRGCATLIRDGFQRFIHAHYYKLFWAPAGALAILDWELAYFIFIVPSFFSFMQTNLVNSFCHLPGVGYRRFDTPDRSTNVPVVAYLSWGLGFHNNHHADPASAYLGREWWEVDVCRYVIPLLAKPGSINPAQKFSGISGEKT